MPKRGGSFPHEWSGAGRRAVWASLALDSDYGAELKRSYPLERGQFREKP